MSDTARGLRHVEHVMGTVITFDIRDERVPAIEAALSEAVSWLHHVDEVYSTYRPESAISRLAHHEIGPDDCSAEVREVLALCRSAVRISGGWFSHLATGFLDPSGLVKGWAVEGASRILYEAGAHIVDPHLGTPANGLASVTVTGPGLTMTDSYATAAFARGESARDWLASLDGYEGFGMLPDGRSWCTDGFPGETVPAHDPA
ncbi:FAD:protein FMN transferase [Streptomyces niveus]|uniref:FAD:protein FMN transferase n=1 Tax=Streptomyces niveus TaxID=193462 RepID=UPI00084C6CEC|nr:FAD:protein FMN transferase [Streptomyces niveus]